MLFFLCLFFSLFLGSGISAIIVMHCIKKSNAYGENEGTFEDFTNCDMEILRKKDSWNII
ncbi:MAG: hypothetical protein IIY81_05525 [Lachnospiraceae bacterium]|jgi:hypothetical protein|nr:hypothetical protein [Lachnospiraceae bacterium]